MDQQQIDNLIADKIALDQMYTATIQQLHECKKQIILKDGSIQKLIDDTNKKLEEINVLEKKLAEALEAQLHIIGLESPQSSE
jgi:hypothetical protein